MCAGCGSNTESGVELKRATFPPKMHMDITLSVLYTGMSSGTLPGICCSSALGCWVAINMLRVVIHTHELQSVQTIQYNSIMVAMERNTCPVSPALAILTALWGHVRSCNDPRTV